MLGSRSRPPPRGPFRSAEGTPATISSDICHAPSTSVARRRGSATARGRRSRPSRRREGAPPPPTRDAPETARALFAQQGDSDRRRAQGIRRRGLVTTGPRPSGPVPRAGEDALLPGLNDHGDRRSQRTRSLRWMASRRAWHAESAGTRPGMDTTSRFSGAARPSARRRRAYTGRQWALGPADDEA